MSVESISTVPSSQTSVGAFTTGLMPRNCSKVLNTETDRCSKGTPSSRSEMAARRTKGESSMPTSCMGSPEKDGSHLTRHGPRGEVQSIENRGLEPIDHRRRNFPTRT